MLHRRETELESPSFLGLVSRLVMKFPAGEDVCPAVLKSDRLGSLGVDHRQALEPIAGETRGVSACGVQWPRSW